MIIILMSFSRKEVILVVIIEWNTNSADFPDLVSLIVYIFLWSFDNIALFMEQKITGNIYFLCILELL